jgi:hypothetical protein
MEDDQKKEKSRVDQLLEETRRKQQNLKDVMYSESGMICVCTVNLSKSSIIRSCMTVT